ncbi:MAG: hypothetical protein MJ093_03900 [Saccharofermentans sp.]|nr:hypothetical protein [Saccharofermentans sp.]
MKSSFGRKALTSLVLVSVIFSHLALFKRDCQADSNTVPVNLELSIREYLSIARSYIGISGYDFRELDGNLTLGFGDNCGWCAEFVTYCMGVDERGSYNPNRSVDDIVRAYNDCGRYYRVNCETNGSRITYLNSDDTIFFPMVGDLVVYDENWDNYFISDERGDIALDENDQLAVNPAIDTSDSFDHIGIVSSVDIITGRICTIEGNTIYWRPRANNDVFGNYIDYKGLYTVDEGAIITDGDSKYYDDKYYCNAALDYNDAGNNFRSEIRTVNEYSKDQVKYCFIKGFCRPNYAEERAFNSVDEAEAFVRNNHLQYYHYDAQVEYTFNYRDIHIVVVYTFDAPDTPALNGTSDYLKRVFPHLGINQNDEVVFCFPIAYSIKIMKAKMKYYQQRAPGAPQESQVEVEYEGETFLIAVSDDIAINEPNTNDTETGDTSTSATEQPVVQDTPTSVPTVSVTPTPQVPTTQVPTTPSTPTPPPMRYPTHLPGIEHMGTRDRMEGDLLGDVNVDGVLDWNDMCYLSPIITLRWANDAALLEEVDAFYGHTVVDVNDDGMINADDSMWMINILSDQNRDRALAEEAAMRNEI